MKLNIGTSTDPFFRYKRDQIEVKHINTKGVQTKLINIELIAKQLHVEQDHLVQHLQKNLGTQIKNDMIRGQITIPALEILIESYIAEFVLCKLCHLPELNKKGLCKACGNSDSKQQPKKKKIVTNRKYSDDDKSEDEEDGQSPLDLEISALMHNLYGIRDRLLQNGNEKTPYEEGDIETKKKSIDELRIQTDGFLDKCWNCDQPKPWKSLKKKIAEFIETNQSHPSFMKKEGAVEV